MTAAIDHARLFVRVYFGVWVLTLAAAAITMLSPAAGESFRGAFVLTFTPMRATLRESASIFATNLSTFSLPIVLAYIVSPWKSPLRGVLSTAAVVLVFVPNILVVGLASGAYGPRLFSYLPHLAIEWAAIAVSLSTWIVCLRRPMTGSMLALIGAINAGIVAAGALVETFVGPTL